MKLISHRGNTKGPSNDLENTPELIDRAIKKGFDVEVDVWYVDGHYWLGHDKPMHPMGSFYLHHPKLWRHAKNLEALRRMLDSGVHCFWHENDERTITSRGYVWTYPGKEYDSRSIIVVNGPVVGEIPKVYGICSDFVELINIPTK
jgi:arabinogalactan endo-1,4-beta-galactosidase